MKKCRYCGAELKDDAKACSNCGRPVDDYDAGAGKNGQETPGSGDAGCGASEDKKSENAQGYWQYGEWHPFSDLNKSSGDNKAENDGTASGSSSGNNYGNSGTNNNSYGGGYRNGNPYGGNGWNSGTGQGSPFENNGWNGNGPRYENGYQEYGTKFNGLAIASLTFGLLSSVLDGFLMFLPSVLAIAFGIAALIQIKKNPGFYRGRWAAIVGIIAGAAFLVFYIVAVFAVLDMMQDPAMRSEFEKYMNEIIQQYGGTGTSA